ncbi:MAG: hypothetical protein NTY48_05975 [Candidatus Diapherotrites archaeon]|nr:hypothetical protein [Candidatus Diapherotrites archaeon]
MNKSKFVSKAARPKSNYKASQKEALYQKLNALNAEQEFIARRQAWIDRWNIPEPKAKKLDLGRGPKIENSPYHFQYYVLRLSRKHELARSMLNADSEY